jgi:23S rRNA pseudouridine1911/1915/1917 synthase
LEEEIYTNILNLKFLKVLLRIDKYLMGLIQNATRTKYRLPLPKEYFVNDLTVKSNYKVKPLDVIRVMLTHPPYENHIVPENIPLNIVYEDDTLLLINKQPGGCSSRSWKLYRTLVHALAYHFDNLPMNSSERPTSASY